MLGYRERRSGLFSREGLLILPGLGYNRGGARALRALAPSMRADGLDLYVPAYLSRRGLPRSRERLRAFIREHRLESYDRVHVFAYIAGAWTFNPLLEDAQFLPNLSTVIYDRSPYQERAPRIAADRLPFLAWLRHGSVVADLARTSYRPLPRSGVRVGLLVETEQTPFVKRFARTARSYGPIAFGCDTFAQPHDDCIFVALNHTELYEQFGEAWPEVRAFIRDGRFTASANRSAPLQEAQ